MLEIALGQGTVSRRLSPLLCPCMLVMRRMPSGLAPRIILWTLVFFICARWPLKCSWSYAFNSEVILNGMLVELWWIPDAECL